jgi:hypothetical protein
VALDTNVIFTFNKNIRAGVGTITLRTVSAGGTIVESYDVASSGRLTFSTNTLTIDPTSTLGVGVTNFVVVPNNAVAGYVGIDTYSFTGTSPEPLGSSYEGGFLICKASPLRWVVSPYSTEVSRDWNSREDANTTAQSVFLDAPDGLYQQFHNSKTQDMFVGPFGVHHPAYSGT